MKAKKLKLYLTCSICVFLLGFSHAQRAGLQLIHHQKSKKYVILDKKRLLKVKYFTNGERIEINGYFDSKTENILKIQQKKKTIYYPSSRVFSEEPVIFHRMLMSNIQSISPLQSPIASFLSLIGFCVIIPSTLMIVGSLSNKTAPFSRESILKIGLIGMGISLPMLLLTKRKKYHLSKDAWEIK